MGDENLVTFAASFCRMRRFPAPMTGVSAVELIELELAQPARIAQQPATSKSNGRLGVSILIPPEAGQRFAARVIGLRRSVRP
jgi:hypothetical protein